MSKQLNRLDEKVEQNTNHTLDVELINTDSYSPFQSAIAVTDMQAEFQVRRVSLSIARKSLDKGTGSLQVVEPNLVDTKADVRDKDLAQDIEVNYHIIDPVSLLKELDTDDSTGLTSTAAQARLSRYGQNTIATGSKLYIIYKYLTFVFGGFGVILWPAAILCLLCYQPLGALQGGSPDPMNLGLSIVLFLVIAFSSFFNAWQDFQSTKVMNSIGSMIPQETLVIRDGATRNAPVKSLVVGDIVSISVGTKVPADIRLLKVDGIKVDNSVLTGESEPISSTVQNTDDNFMESKNILFMGTCVVEGTGIGVVVATGKNTVMGKISKMAVSQNSSTPIKKEINLFMLMITTIALATATVCLLTWAFWLRIQYPSFLTPAAIIVTCIGVVVAFIPEGLPVSVALTFTVMARRMKDKNVLVKNLPTVETLGSINVIASDKTGTLTQNKMSVMHVVINGDRRIEHGEPCKKLFEANDPSFFELVRCSALCNRAFFDPDTLALPVNQRTVNGDASDSGIMLFAQEFVEVQSTRDAVIKLLEIPFNSKNKWMLNIVNDPSKYPSNQCTLYMKGAAEIILEKCSTYLTQDGNEEPITDAVRRLICTQQEYLSSNGERVLACCRNNLPSEHYPSDYTFDAETFNFPMTDHCFIGLLALIDPPRVDVRDAIDTCRKAHVKVMMVTGDHHITASAIARMVGIITTDHVVDIIDNNTLNETNMDDATVSRRAITVKGSVIEELNKHTWDNIFKHNEIVFARTTPEHKLIIVKQCQRRRNVVAVTGDGVNDSIALKAADVGVAMGSGSEVAREAAAIVLLDSKFSSIVAGIENGRMAFDNLKKVILYLLPAGSFSELTPVLASVFLGYPQPLSTFLMLAICVATDIFPSLSLIYEEAEADLMTRKPRSMTKERLVNPQLLLHAYLFTGIYESVAAFTMFFYYMWVYGGISIQSMTLLFSGYSDGFGGRSISELNELFYTGQTVFFVTLVIVQFGNLLSTRTRYLSFFQHNPVFGKAKNHKLFWAMVVSTIIAMFVVYLPLFNIVFRTRPIPTQFWFIPLGWAALYFCIDEVRKVIVRCLPPSVVRYISW